MTNTGHTHSAGSGHPRPEPDATRLPARAAGAALTSVVALLAAASPALATGGMDVSPSRIDAHVQVGGKIPPVTIRNTSPLPVTVSAQALPATQDLSGQPAYILSAKSRRAGNGLLRLSPKRFTLPPGGARRVSATVLACPRVGLGNYGVILFSGEQSAGTSPRGTKGRVTPMLRLASTFLLSYPAAPCVDGELSGLRGEQAGSRTLGFFARMTNLGDIHAKPAIKLTILRGGRVAFRGSFPSENVIPRATRDYGLTLPASVTLRKGRYVAVAAATLGSRHSSRRWKFTLTGANRLPSPKLSLTGIATSGTSSGSELRLAAIVRNLGTGPGPATVKLSLSKAGGSPLETRTLHVRAIAARGAWTARAGLAKLPEGQYEASAQLISNGEVASEKTTTFRVEPQRPLFTRALDWATAHLLIAAAAAIALILFLVLAMLALVTRARRRRRRRAAQAETLAALELAQVAPLVPAPSELELELAEIRRELAELREQAYTRELEIADEQLDVRAPHVPVPAGHAEPAAPTVLDGLLITRRAVAATIERRRRAAQTRR